MVEHWTCNRKVVGSYPTSATLSLLVCFISHIIFPSQFLFIHSSSLDNLKLVDPPPSTASQLTVNIWNNIDSNVNANNVQCFKTRYKNAYFKKWYCNYLFIFVCILYYYLSKIHLYFNMYNFHMWLWIQIWRAGFRIRPTGAERSTLVMMMNN